ncbi:hypothetical protein CONCODRAFT_78181 [Conidiobolus coronatus NRRL 28638]|uniref:Uncharacterized protein n=1 Tax=Conidiobolus coronatus (strain ATCC 28846 / CBS 209.66 / NRRL 28638) TaxID=796925 RepID=A0A137P9S9_CONC2|nr:hypothetical protein CONCODRAFT_78181 [Conidiobolus coronatus NRRL 28638]|eukprot:KXN71749.1 hypothetical protein CONCODRAFT_78181 [Conidiobolus coronatus NRRL 28638]
MKATTFLSVLIAPLSAEFWLEATRSDGTVAHIGGTPGCFGTVGPFTKAVASENVLALFYDDYGCKGKQVYDVVEGTHSLPDRKVKSIEIFDLGNL